MAIGSLLVALVPPAFDRLREVRQYRDTVRALFIVRCGGVESREGMDSVAYGQLLVYNEQGQLDLGVSANKVTEYGFTERGGQKVLTAARQIDFDTLRTLAISWVNFTSEYLAEHGEHVRVDPGWKLLPSFGLGKREISARYREFPRKRLASRAVIVNMLARFHKTVAPIAEVEVGL